jgi:predicted MFS family arabinose efflux permease
MGLLGTMSAAGTALGPALGGLLLAASNWRALFLLTVPLGALAWVLARRHLPGDEPATAGTAPVAIRLELLRKPALWSALAMNFLVMSVMMTTLIAGPFHLARGLGLGPAALGLAMSAGPLVAALTGFPAGRLVDRIGTRPATLCALAIMAAGAALIALAPLSLGAPGYIAPLAVVTAGYALFQAAANTAVMAAAAPAERGLVSGLLTLSRNLGLIAGASLMAALFASQGLRITFLAAAALIAAAIAIALAVRPPSRRAQASVL